jgi:hypothetical protein
VAERSQANAVAKLRHAGISDEHLIVVLEYFMSLQRSTLDEIEAIFTHYDALCMSQPGKTALHDQWLTSQISKVRWVYEEAVTTIMVAAMQYVQNNVHQAVTYEDKSYFLVIPAKVGVWLLGLLAGLLFAWVLTNQSIIWTAAIMLAPLTAWVMLGLSNWGLLVPLCLIGLVVIPVVISL